MASRPSTVVTRALPAVLVRARGQICALPVEQVIETMRPLAVRCIAGAAPPVLGLSIVRGAAIPVVDLGAVLGGPGSPAPTRFVVVRAGPRAAALAVDSVLGMRVLDAGLVAQLPPLFRPEGSQAVESTLAVDAELVVLLRAARLVPEEAWGLVEVAGTPT